MKVIVTGGAGFIGSALVRRIIATTDWQVINIDKLTYAGNMESLAPVAASRRHRFVRMDICDRNGLSAIFAQEQPDAVMHLAAESHVDRSIDGPGEFIQTNIVGSYTLLECARQYWSGLEGVRRDVFRFHHVSTDEVYGSLGADGRFTEASPYRPNSPYSASKAASDHLARAWFHTFGLPSVISNCSNNFGPYQFPEKLIPLMILRATLGQPLPIYGKGENVRDWLYVDDHADALMAIVSRGRPGEVYNVGGDAERRNIDVVTAICGLLDELLPGASHRPHANLLNFVADRPGHDARYAIDCSKMRIELGWTPRETFDSGLRKTVLWYLENQLWLGRVLSGEYRGERLGLRTPDKGRKPT